MLGQAPNPIKAVIICFVGLVGLLQCVYFITISILLKLPLKVI